MIVLVAMLCSGPTLDTCTNMIWKEVFDTQQACMAVLEEQLPKIPAPYTRGFCFTVPLDEAT